MTEEPMSIEHQRQLGQRIIERLPNNEEDLALALGATRQQIASTCRWLHKQRRIKVDQDWDTPRHWKL